MKPNVFRLPWKAGQQYNLVPLCCAHWPEGDTDLLKEWVEQLAADPFAFTILLGDQFDFARTHYRKHAKKYQEDGNSQVAIDKMHRKEVEGFTNLLLPIQEKIIGVLQGNHVWEFADTKLTNDQLLCEKLEVPFLGAAAFTRLEFKEGLKTKISLTMFSHHTGGCKGSRTQSGDTNALEKMESGWDADIYVAGHTHRRYSFKKPKLMLSGRGTPVVRERTRCYIRAGALLHGFDETSCSATKPYVPSYAEQDALPPTDLGWVTCKINFQDVRVGDAHTLEPRYKLEF